LRRVCLGQAAGERDGGAGCGSAPLELEFPGLETSAGQVLTTHHWPDEDVDLTGKRVGVIGTGSSGLQVIPKLAEQAGHLTVFQRTPNCAAPLCNRPTDPEEARQVKATYPARSRIRSSQKLSDHEVSDAECRVHRRLRLDGGRGRRESAL
jgi:cation diffusion facilitator CzcD-associated flavoprotein CzcO